MKRKFECFALATLILVISLAMTACSAKVDPPATSNGDASTPAKTYTIIAGQGGADDLTIAKGTIYLADLLAERTDGGLILELYTNAQLGNDRELIESCSAGNVTMCMPSTAPLANFVPEIAVFETPFMFSDRGEVYAFLDGELGEQLLETTASIGIKGLGYFENGFRDLSCNRVIEQLSDMNSMKIRVMENDIHLAIWNALGANPAPLAFSELYTALQQGTFDAQENPYENILFQKFYEVQDYVYNTHHIYTPYPCLINEDFYNSLPADYQQILTECVAEAIEYQRGLCETLDTDARAQMEAAGVQFIDPSDALKAEMVEACTNVYAMILDKAGDTSIAVYDSLGIDYTV